MFARTLPLPLLLRIFLHRSHILDQGCQIAVCEGVVYRVVLNTREIIEKNPKFLPKWPTYQPSAFAAAHKQPQDTVLLDLSVGDLQCVQAPTVIRVALQVLGDDQVPADLKRKFHEH